MTNAHELAKLGQSVWLDYIRRSFIADGGLQAVVDQGVRGVTSNPAIFEKAIAGSADYDAAIRKLARAGKSTNDIYEALAIEDIQRAADILRPVYDESNGEDGFVSLEVSPTLAKDTDGTTSEARRLWKAVDRPNVMIKVPATNEGIPAIQTLIAEGINVNVTLIFGIAQYEDVMNAYLNGLEALTQNGGDASSVASVASFFVSRVDSAVDKALEDAGNTELQGKIAVANAKIAYERFGQIFSGERWESLASKGAKVQRPLWASTSTKNPNYKDTLYVDTLIGKDTVNTMPNNTFDALLDHGEVAVTIDQDVQVAHEQIAQLETLGIDFNAVTNNLLEEGVRKFEEPFAALMDSLDSKRKSMQDETEKVEFSLNRHQKMLDDALQDVNEVGIIHRIWAHDHTVWKDDPTEITNRLGWLRIMDVMQDNLDRINHLVSAVQRDGYQQALLLGMGGSSLAPEVLSNTFGTANDHLNLAVLDSTDPGAVLAAEEQLDFEHTLFIVSTKSGGTAETLSFFKYFYNRTVEKLGKDKAGAHFIAITDPGSKLEKIADEYQFRATFLNDPNIGGRYSALSYFGMIPAALSGIDIKTLLKRASTMAVNCDRYNSPANGDNYGGKIGTLMGEMAKNGRDKLTFVISPSIRSFGDWVEQLIAESTGKEGKGILPVVGEPLGTPDVYGSDRLFVYLRLKDDNTYDALVNALEIAGHPIMTVHMDDLYDIGAQFFLWEMATAVASQRLEINPFDQPNVESAKVLARQTIKQYQETGKLPELTAAIEQDGLKVFGETSAGSPQDALRDFLNNPAADAYIALQAYVQPTSMVDKALGRLRAHLRDNTKLATSLGFGPRFLHSTGQLHKGDSGNGLFVIFSASMPQDVDIPDDAGSPESGMSFGTLKTAQMLGDRQALLDNGRKVLLIDLGDNPEKAVDSFVTVLV